MLLEVASFALLGYLGYYFYAGPETPSTVSGKLAAVSSNGYMFRDVMFSDFGVDLSHPDVKNNSAFNPSSWVAKDRGPNGVPRGYLQEIPGLSTVTQVYRTDNLIL